MPSLMKGHTWRDHSHKMTYPCVAEVKYDEIRCHVIVTPDEVKFLSYAGKPLANMVPYWDTLFRALSEVTGYSEFDLGFEVNGNFNDSYRWVRSTKGLPEDLRNAPTKFILFDLPEIEDAYALREFHMDRVVEYAHHLHLYTMHRPLARTCLNKQEVDEFYVEMREAGYEGLMVKSMEHTYQRGKRIYGWLKMKPENDADGQIVGFEEAVCGKDQPEKGLKAGDLLGRIGSVLVHCEDGSQAAPHGIPHALGRDMYLHPEKYVGQWCEFKFMERDRQGGYRHPTFHRLREDKV